MNFAGLASDPIKDLDPAKIADYLRNHDWHEQETISNKASIWIQNFDSSSSFEILLPLRSESPDFVRRVTELLETLEVSEQLPKSQILDELTDLSQVAQSLDREVINLGLSFPSYYGTEVSISSLGSILKSLQETLNGIAQSLAIIDDRLAPKKISADLARGMELSAVGRFKGSFGLKLVSAPAHLIESNLVINSLKEFIDLISIGSEIEGLRERLFKLRSKSARKYVNFLKSLADSNADLSVEWGSACKNYGGSARLTVQVTKDTLRSIREMKTESIKTIRLTGRLTQGDVKTQRFKFEDDQGNQYVGYIDDEAMPSSGILSLNKNCEVTMEEKITNFFITDREEASYTIIGLSFPGEATIAQPVVLL